MIAIMSYSRKVSPFMDRFAMKISSLSTFLISFWSHGLLWNWCPQLRYWDWELICLLKRKMA